MDEQPGALDVGEEVVPEARTAARPLDQPRDVREHQLAVVGLQRAEHGLERRERIGGDLGLGARHPGQQRGLARVRQPHEADVREQLEVQLDLPLLSRQPALGQPRGLARGGLEARVPPATGPAAGDRHLLAGPHEVVARPVPAGDLRARRDADEQRLAVRSVALGALPVPAAPRAEMRAPAKALQVAQVVVAAQHDVAPAAAVAAVRAALGHVGLAPERQAPVAARAGADLDLGAVVEHWAIIAEGVTSPKASATKERLAWQAKPATR